MGVLGLGFRVWEFRVLELWVWGLGFGVWEFRGLELWVLGLGEYGLQGSHVLGFRVLGWVPDLYGVLSLGLCKYIGHRDNGKESGSYYIGV